MTPRRASFAWIAKGYELPEPFVVTDKDLLCWQHYGDGAVMLTRSSGFDWDRLLHEQGDVTTATM